MPIYPLPPGCIFREDFVSTETVVANGGVVTGGLYIKNGVSFVNDANKYIDYKYAKIEQIINKYSYDGKLTIATTLVFPSDSVRRDILSLRSINPLSSNNIFFILRKDSGSPQILIILGNGVGGISSYLSSAVSSANNNKKTTIIWALGGSGVLPVIYINGQSLALSSPPAALTVFGNIIDSGINFRIGADGSATNPMNSKLYTVQLYDYAFTAADALDWHNVAMRN